MEQHTCISRLHVHGTWLIIYVILIDFLLVDLIGAFIGVKWFYNFAFVSVSTSVTAAADSTKLSRSLVLAVM